MKLWTAIRATIADLGTPGVGNPYQRGVIFMAHAMVGAAVNYGMGGHGWLFAVALGVSYFAFKESADLRKGGRLMDSLEDTAAVIMGASGVAWWPVAVLPTALGIMVLTRVQR